MSEALPMPGIVLRPYQVLGVERIHESFTRVRSALIVVATGAGKTTMFSKVIEDRRPLGRALVVAHRGELLQQAAKRIEEQTGLRCETEKANMRARLDGFYPPDVVVASVQTLAKRKRLEAFTEFDFSTVIIDEAHHAPAASYGDILSYFAHAKVLGVTATPDRTDKTAMGLVFEEVAFVYDIRDAIDDGYLVPIVQKAVEVHGLDLSKIKTVAGDLNEGELDKLLREEEHLHHIAQPTVELSDGRKTMVFCVTVQHAHDLAKVLRAYGATAEALDGSADEHTRKQVLGRFARGETRFLCNCMLLTEGFDEPSIACIAVARPTKSRSLYCQMAGRGTRLHPQSGKKDLLLLDFRGNAGRHALVAPVDLLGGDMEPKVRKRAEDLAAQGVPVHEAVDQAKLEARERAEIERAAREREETSKLQVEARKRVREVDPFGVFGVQRQSVKPLGGPPTPKQIEYLQSLGFPAERDVWKLDKRTATELIDKLRDRRQGGFCTFKQAEILAKHGYSTDVPKKVASEIISRILSGDRERTPGEDG